MKSIAKLIAHPETGLLITPGKTEGWGVIRVDQEVFKMENGIVNRSNRSAFIRGKMSDLAGIVAQAQAGGLSGKIIRQESTTPFYVGQKAKINPTTKAVVTHNGAPVYFQDLYTESSLAQDSLLASDKVAASVEAEK